MHDQHLAKPILVFLAQQQGLNVTLYHEMERLQQQPEGAALQNSSWSTNLFPVPL